MDAPVNTEPPLPTYDHQCAIEIARATMLANPALVDRAGTGGRREDLVHDLATEIWRSWDRFDPNIASFTTFASRIAKARLIDRTRRTSATRRRGWLQASEDLPGKDAEAVKSGTSFLATFTGVEGTATLPRLPRKLSRWGDGTAGHPPSAYFAAIVLRESRGLTWKELHRTIAADATLRAELGFSTAPGYSNLRYSYRRLKLWAKRRARNSAQPTPPAVVQPSPQQQTSAALDWCEVGGCPEFAEPGGARCTQHRLSSAASCPALMASGV